MIFHVEPVAEVALDDRDVDAILEALARKCECCGSREDVRYEASRTAYHFDPQEGGPCPVSGCAGDLEFTLPDSCSCITSPMPPCGSCTSSFLTCSICHVPAEDHDPNRDVALCRPCAVDYHEHWDHMWAEYNSGRL